MIALGTAQLTRNELPQRLVESLIDTAASLGVRYVDTARCYTAAGEAPGTAEAKVARAVARLPDGRRPQIGTKCGLTRSAAPLFDLDARPETIVRHCRDSLRHLGVRAIDLLLLHWPDPAVPLRRSLRTLEELREENLVRTIGICNVDVDTLAREGAHVRLDVVQVRFDHTTLPDLLGVAEHLKVTCQVYGLFDRPAIRDRLRDKQLMAGLLKVRALPNHAAVLAAITALWPAAVPLVGTTRVAHLEQLLSRLDVHPDASSSHEIIHRVYGAGPC